MGGCRIYRFTAPNIPPFFQFIPFHVILINSSLMQTFSFSYGKFFSLFFGNSMWFATNIMGREAKAMRWERKKVNWSQVKHYEVDTDGYNIYIWKSNGMINKFTNNNNKKMTNKPTQSINFFATSFSKM